MTILPKRLGVPLAALAAVFAGSTLAHATVLYSTDFNGPTYSDAALVGQDGWLQTGTVVTNPLLVANTGTNGRVTLATSGQDVNRPYLPAVTSDSIYLSADITITAAQATGDYFLHLSDGGASNFNARMFAKSSGAGFVMALGTGAGATPTYGATELAFGTTYHILARYDFVVGAGNDTGALFVNPADPFGVGDTAYAAATTQGTDATSLSAVCIRQGTAASAATVTIDNINVAVVPGPAPLALLGLGGLVALRRRR
jgi:MYXO-CTERM domain-containing protein